MNTKQTSLHLRKLGICELELVQRFTMRTEVQPWVPGRDETPVANNCELREPISEVDETKPPEVFQCKSDPPDATWMRSER